MTARKTLAALNILWTVGAVGFLALFVAGMAPANAQQPQFFIYRMGTHDLSEDSAMTVGKFFGLTSHTAPIGTNFANEPPDPCVLFTGAFADGSTHTRMIYLANTGQLKCFTDFSKTFGSAPSQQAAIDTAQSFLVQHDLLPAVQKVNGSFGADVVTTANQGWQMNPAGGIVASSSASDFLQTVVFPLELNGVVIHGPTYKLSVDISSNGVEGFTHAFRVITLANNTPVTLITQAQATSRFNSVFAPELKILKTSDPKTAYKVIDTDMVYFEQGQTYIQPAYHFQVQITSSDGTVHGRHIYIAAATNSPELIKNLPDTTFGEQAVTPMPPGAAASNTSSHITDPSLFHLAGLTTPPATAKSKAGVYDPLPFGVYVVRDDNRFLNGANGFIANLQSSNVFANILGAGYPQVVLNQYYWDYPWLWENDPADGVPDNSPFFVGANNIVLYEGHGAPWLGTTYSNCCDLINYPGIAGYGAFHGGEITSYILWHTCDSVPAPGDPYGGDYTSPHGPADVWFTIFQGLRGIYGSRTTVNIYDNVEPEFAWAAGFGAANLSNWLNSEANDATGHGGGWDYACCVIIPGHQNDTIYDTAPLPPPGSLTMYWQHP